jgi:RNA polymerase sigma-70 factor (ECF subfamily)
MSDTKPDALRRSLILDYEELRVRLTRHLGSAELANDALQETFLRLHREAELPTVERPRPYLLRMAARIAVRKLRGEKQTISLDDAKAAFGVADEAADSYRILAARRDLEAFQRAVAELTPRRREILYAARIEGLTLRTIAERQGISQRLVELELKDALAHCALRLDRKLVQRFGPQPHRDSSIQDVSDSED